MSSRAEYLAVWNKKYVKNSCIKSFLLIQEFMRDNDISNARQGLFHAIHEDFTLPKCVCGNHTTWNIDRKEYRKFCSKKCSGIHTEHQRRKTSIERYGVYHYSKTQEFSDKIKRTSIDRYGVNHYSKTLEFKNSVLKSNNRIYGVNYPSQNEVVAEQIKKTNLEKHGVECVLQSLTIRAKITNTNLQKFGVETPFQSDIIRTKIKKTNLEKHGVENPIQNSAISTKSGNTRKNNYYNSIILEKLNDPVWLTDKNKSGMSVYEISRELNVSASNLAKYFHSHGIEICRHYRSSYEKTITQILDDYGIQYIINNRKLIYPYELDIVIPSIKLAIEINGGYWHHEDRGKHKLYHLTKTQMCQKIGLELWHIFDWEIDQQLDIIISKLQHKLKLSRKIFARTLKVHIISHKEKHAFIVESHLQGDCVSRINLGLKDAGGKLWAVMTFGKCKFNKKYYWEMLRFCCKQGHAVTGGGSKILKYFINNFTGSKNLISYCDLRFYTGNFYEALGFQKISTCMPNYFYVDKNGDYVGSQKQWQQHILNTKLSLFDATLSEVANMNANGYHRIWDCGTAVYLLE